MVYKSKLVADIESFYGALLRDFERYEYVQRHLQVIALKLFEGLKQKTPCLFSELNNYNKKFIGRSVAELGQLEFTLEDAQETIAQEYGFASWRSLTEKDPIKYNVIFQKAIDHLLLGENKELEALLNQYPALVQTKSSYGHQAQLIHYVGSNGFEFWRQVVPTNLATITKLLLDYGADPKAKMLVYGGAFTLSELVSTSIHPKKAGVLEDVLGVLGVVNDSPNE